MISLSNLSYKIKTNTTTPISTSNLLENTFVLTNYYNPGYPNPYNPQPLLFSNYTSLNVDAAPANWLKIPRKISFLNLSSSGNIWKSHDYNTLLARYPVGTFFYIVYKGRLFRLRFNGAENSQIRNTSIWHMSNNTWVETTDTSMLNTSPDGQTIDGRYIYWYEPFLSVVEVFSPGVLDLVSARSNCVAAYGIKKLSGAYNGPIVKYIRSNDNTMQDFYSDTTGTMTDINGSTLSSWLGGSTANIVTWYDQTGRGKHMNVETIARPSIITGDSNAIYLTGSTRMAASNVFDTTSVSTMHLVSSTREIGRTGNYLISLNGTVVDLNRFSTHMPWSDGTWYWDPWDGNINNRASTGVGFTSVGQKAVFSSYKGGFRINGGTTFTSSENTAASVAGGLRVGALPSSSANHYIYNLLIFNNRLSLSDETIIENAM